jgi:hypothetical protein
MSEDVRLRRGRPRKHATPTARVQAFSRSHDFRKITVDIPHECEFAFRELVKYLRKHRKQSQFILQILESFQIAENHNREIPSCPFQWQIIGMI